MIRSYLLILAVAIAWTLAVLGLAAWFCPCLAEAETLKGECKPGADQVEVFGPEWIAGTAVPDSSGKFTRQFTPPEGVTATEVEVSCHHAAGWTTARPFAWLPDDGPVGLRVRP